MLISRRNFLQTTAGSAFLLGFPELSRALNNTENRRLLVILLRGGMDGITAVPPIGDKELKSIRSSIYIENSLALNDFFSLHPSMTFFHSAYKDNKAAIVHATSFPYKGRSHFDGQNVMESGVDQPNSVNSGWLGRAMGVADLGSLAFSLPIPLILRGNLNSTNHYPTELIGVSDKVYESIFQNWSLNDELKIMADKLDLKRSMGSMRRSPGALVSFATDQLALDHGPRVGIIDLVGFDTHAEQGNGSGKHAEMLSQLDNLMKQFKFKMQDKWEDSLIITVTEFGRTAKENGTKGTDHGWASCMFLSGGLVNKGKVVSDWPGLKSSSLYEGRDLKLTIDARDIYSEVVSKVFGIDPGRVSKDVFLGYKPKKDWQLIRGLT